MIQHGDDIHNYQDIRLNFSSNVFNHFDHSGLFRHLSEQMPRIMSYPEPTPTSLEAKLADTLGIRPEEVMVTNGATEAIYLIAQTFREAKSHIMQPTFGEYAEACCMAMHSITSMDDAGIVWLCNPNNPTGKVRPHSEVVEMIGKTPSKTFVIDQSYDCFTTLPTLSAQEAVAMSNVLLLHSMTKEYAIPGLRLGYVIGNARLLDRIRKMRMPWSVNVLAIEAGKYLTDHHEDYHFDLNALFKERQRVGNELKARGIDVYESDTHILLCRLNEGCAAELKERLATGHGILIRDASNFAGLTPQHFRIAVQEAAENNELIRAIDELQSHNGLDT